MKQIRLSKSRFALVDDEDYEWLSAFTWSASKHRSGRKCYAVRRNEDGVWLYMHREIVDMMSDYPVSRDLVIDHVDNNGLNNQRNNLRVRTRNENTRMYHAIQARKLAKSSRQIHSPSDREPLPKASTQRVV